MLVPIQVGISMASPYKSLYVWVKHLDISYTKYSSDPNLGEGLWMSTSFYFPDSGLKLLNGFDFYFDLLWSDTENQQYEYY